LKIRLYLDEDSMDRDLVRALAVRGVDVSTALEAGLVARSDREHLEHATAEGRVVYTFNVRDFHRLHVAFLAEGKAHAGIILARQQHHSIGEQLRRILQLIASLSAEEMRGRVEFLSGWG